MWPGLERIGANFMCEPSWTAALFRPPALQIGYRDEKNVTAKKVSRLAATFYRLSKKDAEKSME
jgi:hypothetical protein